MLVPDKIIDFKDWLDEEINSGKNYFDYINDIGHFDKKEFLFDWLSETEVEYLDAKKEKLQAYSACLKELIKNIKETIIATI